MHFLLILGLCWVAQYYYGPCPSWSFYYPFYYAPFASDFGQLNGIEPRFDSDTRPARPLELLMHVLPPASALYLPESWAKLMTDVQSPLTSYYPSAVNVDMNGRRFAWQGKAKLSMPARIYFE